MARLSSEEAPPLQAVLDALDDDDCRAILRAAAEPTTAPELSDACDVPRSTLYRKLELLTDASLLRERETITPGGGRTTEYERDVDDVTISVGDDFSVAVERPSHDPDERLADVWSKLPEGSQNFTVGGE